MKLWIMSDLHLSALRWRPSRIPPHDVLVVAGDVKEGMAEFHDELSKIRHITQKPVIAVPGNHDHFGQSLGSFMQWDGGVHILPAGDTITIDGVRFIGATLWTDWLLNDREYQAQAWAARHMPDYGSITRPGGDLIWPRDGSDQHDLHRAAIEAVLQQPHAGPTVVVTHHAPSIQSLKPGDRTHEFAGAYASDLEDVMTRYRPQLWVHGHIHHASDYRVGATRIICNPRGYQAEDWEERTGWQEDLVIDV
jgi:Icc-related predicted phosphoesterase